MNCVTKKTGQMKLHRECYALDIQRLIRHLGNGCPLRITAIQHIYKDFEIVISLKGLTTTPHTHLPAHFVPTEQDAGNPSASKYSGADKNGFEGSRRF